MNADPRRPEKVQRYVPKTNNGTGTEDLTSDYMNILGQNSANVGEVTDKLSETTLNAEPNLQVPPPLEEVQHVDELSVAVTTNPTNVIPTSPQYGVAIISNTSGVNDPTTETLTLPTETLTDSTAKSSDDSKDLHSTPNRNERFKVVKIASLEPFKRGRWKCMDYVDEAPPAGIRMPQSTGSIQITGGPYIQTQSLPQQQIQQMLLQGGFTNGTQFFTTVPTQILPQGQYFYPQVANAQSQTIQQPVPSSLPAQFIANQPYFPAGVVQNAGGFTMPQSFQNVQYVPANLVQNQTSAFVPTSQTVQLPQNFQQGQTYAGQTNVSQANVSQQPMVNGHSYTPQNEQVIGSLPTQTVKNVILNAVNTQPVVSQSQILPQQNLQNQIPVQTSQTVPVIQTQQFQQNYQPTVQGQQQQTQNANQSAQTAASVQVQSQPVVQTVQVSATVPSQSNLDQTIASNVYTNPQFAMSVNSLTVLENSDNQTDVNDAVSSVEANGENPDDPAKTNPVVNAIDNKIEQAMDLVKSHLMYTVREEVEVLKEKIADLMERIQQLETENNFLRSQIPKNQVLPPAPSLTVSQSQTTSTTTNFVPSTNPSVAAPHTSTPVTNPSPNSIPNSLPASQTSSAAAGTETTIKPQ